MSGWNHRVLQDADGVNVVEVYYDDDGLPYAWCEASPYGESVGEVQQTLLWMVAACERPVLTQADFTGTLITEVDEIGAP